MFRFLYRRTVAAIKGAWNGLTGHVRGYRDVIGSGGAYSDWPFNFLSEDGDLRNNIPLLRDRSRDLYKTNCYFRKYKEEQFANVFGEEGLRLRMKVKETEDRVVFAADEKAFWEKELDRKEKVADYLKRNAERFGVDPTKIFQKSGYDRATATVKAGAIDLFACRMIEKAYKDWQRKETCTMSKKFTYNQVRQLRLLSCSRDGDFFIRLIRGAQAGNKFGFSLQLINSEYCDFNLNVDRLPNGNSIRMGIEMNSWGEAINYHFIKPTTGDWMAATPGLTGGMGATHEVIPAKDIIHYARLEYGDSTRGAPWCASIIGKARQLDRFEEAEVIAARVAACKLGFLKSTVQPEGGYLQAPDPCKRPMNWDQVPGGILGLPAGVEFQEWNPNHPNQNYEQFRKAMVRSICAGMPGADYNILANDLEGISYSAGRLGRLDSNELWKLLQKFDIETAEQAIFENWLEMALATGAIKLPLLKFEKYNQPHFSGRRWAGVDPVKETTAAVLAITNKLMSFSKWYDDQAWDLEETWMEIAEEQMLAEELGIQLPPTAGIVINPKDYENEDDTTEETSGGKKPSAKKAA